MKAMINSPRFWILTIMIIVTALSRLLPHPPNFTPIAAIALFGAAYFKNKKMAFIIPITAMFVSDLIIGMHNTLLFVYLAFVLVGVLGFQLRGRVKTINVIGSSLAASVVFFLITNFGSWLAYDMYSKDLAGLLNCYTAAIPFFRNTVLGDLFFVGVLIGGFELLQYRFPKLARVKV